MTDSQTHIASQASPSVLVIDDEATQRILSQECLQMEGFHVEVASDGEAGLRAARELRPDLVLLDVMMPGLDGFEICRRIRADKDLGRVPVVLVTGLEDLDAIKLGFRIGATDFVTKPVAWPLLPYRLRFIVRASQLAQALASAKETAEAASQAKSLFLSSMGQNLRSPLSTIIGFAELLRSEQFGPIGIPQYKDYVQGIATASHNLLGLINNILDIAKNESGKLVLQESEVSLPDLVELALHEMQQAVHAKSLNVVNMVRAARYHVRGDQHRLLQILLKLLSNAIKFTAEGGRIQIYLDGFDDGSLALVVQDSGVGIAPEELPRILEPFELAGNSLGGTQVGASFGVSRALGLARLHGGDLKYDSAPGKGTKAALILPRERVLGWVTKAERAEPVRKLKSPSGSAGRGSSGSPSGSPSGSSSRSPKPPSGSPSGGARSGLSGPPRAAGPQGPGSGGPPHSPPADAGSLRTPADRAVDSPFPNVTPFRSVR